MKSEKEHGSRKRVGPAFALAPVVVVLVFTFGCRLPLQSRVTLNPSASPSFGQAGVTVINVIGSGFPRRTIPPANVTVTLQPSAGGSSVATTATAVTKINGATERVTFQIPSSITVSSPTSYQVSMTGSTSTGVNFASDNAASLTINPAAEIVSVAPNSGQAEQTVTVVITGSYTNFLQGSTEASFGAGISVGGASAGALGPVTVTSPTSATALLVIDPAAVAGAQPVALQTGVQQESLPNGFTVTPATVSAPVITEFSPNSASIGTVITVQGSDLAPTSGVPLVTLAQQGGGTIAAPVATFTATAISFVIPTGAASGSLKVTVGAQSTSSTTSLSIVPPSNFGLAVFPGTANLIQGQSTAYAVALSSTSGFNQLATLTVSGLPTGVTATFTPTGITAGQTSVLMVTAPASQAIATATLSISASATVASQNISQSASATLQVTAVTTSLLGRTVVDDAQKTPIAGVTVKFLGKDASGNLTGCSGQTVSDGAGNFSLTSLPSSCIGPQLVSYDGSTATSPPGQYAGVNLSYTLTSAQVTTSPVLIHLPRTDNAETVQVQQNASADQAFTFHTIPGLMATVYAGTTFTLDDGSQPNPFPLIAIKVPVDRLPDVMPASGNVMPFIVAFQPANATASQPVAVSFPNSLNTPPGLDMTFMTLDPTRGFMVPYGTGTVSNDGSQIIPDSDPAHPGHRYGLVHFDWHGPTPPPPPGPNPSPDPCGPRTSNPVDLSSGLEAITSFDVAINGLRGPISINRIYRTLSTNPGPFGIGTGHNYSYQLGTVSNVQGPQSLITLVMPDGNQYPFNLQPNGTLVNSTIPSLRGAVIANPCPGQAPAACAPVVYSLRLRDGTVFLFHTPPTGELIAYLNSITDPNGNAITLVHGNSASPIQITQVTDPVGRSLTLNYDSSDRITSIVDPIGRTASYTYNAQGTLATVTNPLGGVTSYAYDSQNRLTQITDPRGVVLARNTYDANGRVIQQVQADGGVIKFSYTLLNPTVATSPVMLTAVTDPLGSTTTYRFDPNGFLLDVTDPTGQMRVFSRSPQNNLVTAVTGTGSCPACGNTSRGNLTFTYDGNGNLATRTDILGDTTTYTYDPIFDRVSSITDPLGSVFRYTYDSHGKMLTATDPNGNTTSYAYDPFGQPIQTTDAFGQSRAFSYDAFGNLVSATNPLENKISFGYDLVSRPIESVDALGGRTTTTYDALDRIVTATNAQVNTIHLSYDAVSNLLSAADEKGSTTSFTYDSMRRLKTRTDPVGKTDTRTYDLNGNPIKFVDRRGQTSTLTYDAINRPNSAAYQDGSTVTVSYDTNGRPVHLVDSAGGTFDYSYDSAGRRLSSASQFGTVQYFYDATGRVSSRQVVGQSALTYSYDANGNTVSAALPQATVNFAYDARDRLLKLTRSNGVSSVYTYDAVGNVLSITHSGGLGIQIPFAYSYNAANSRSLYTTNVAEPQAVTNTFDAGGRLVQSGSVAYTYDDNGNLTSATDTGGTTTYTWDSRDRLQSISLPNSQKTTFLYDFGRNLISQTDSGPTSNLKQNLVLDRTNVAYISRSNGDSLSVLAGRTLDQHLAVVHASGQAEYVLADALNSTTATADQNGKLISSFSYEPFGKTTTISTFPFQFTGRMPINGSLYYFRARCYDSAVGRFISQDPLDLFRGGTSYIYVSNSPINFLDPAGLQTGKALAKACGEVGLVVGIVGTTTNSQIISGAGMGLDLTSCFAGPECVFFLAIDLITAETFPPMEPPVCGLEYPAVMSMAYCVPWREKYWGCPLDTACPTEPNTCGDPNPNPVCE